jgi:hypothetical protein
MSSVNSAQLLQQLQQQVKSLQVTVTQEFSHLPAAIILQAPAPGKWSIAQCLEHLNSYGRYYIPALEKALQQAEKAHSTPAPEFKSSWLGNYFTKMMLPTENGQLRSKMKSPKDHHPPVKLDASHVVSTFLNQQQTIEQLLQRAQKVNIQKVKVPISISRWIKLSAGDTFRFLIAHEQRHILQASKVLVQGYDQLALAIK